MSARQSLYALLVLFVLCQTIPFCLCVGLRITCPNQRCYGALNDVRSLRQREEALRKLTNLMQTNKMERMAAAQAHGTQFLRVDYFAAQIWSCTFEG